MKNLIFNFKNVTILFFILFFNSSFPFIVKNTTKKSIVFDLIQRKDFLTHSKKSEKYIIPSNGSTRIKIDDDNNYFLISTLKYGPAHVRADFKTDNYTKKEVNSDNLIVYFSFDQKNKKLTIVDQFIGPKLPIKNEKKIGCSKCYW